MNDTITGVLVLERMPEPGIWRIWFQYTRSDGLIGYSTIPMKRKGDPKPANHVGPLWDFVERSPFLDCSPSVRILGHKEGAPDHFHNEGAWTNYYVVMRKPYPEAENPDAREVCGMINSHSTKEERDGVIFFLRDQGVLL